MIKLRNANFCNLKLFLIFLVIYGHLIEPQIEHSAFLMIQYRCIYLIHMPLFSFLSGLFLNNAHSCKAQFLRLFPLYILLQAMSVFLGNAKLLTPFWYLWYLFTLCTWLAFTFLWFRFCNGKGAFLILIASISIGCFCGVFPFIGRTFSLSRTLVFFPYFWTGVICKPSVFKKNLRPFGIVIFILFLPLIVYAGTTIPVTFLYHANPYDSPEYGTILRLMCYLTGGVLGLFLLSCIPDKRFSFTKMGTNTMPAYIIHGPVVLFLRQWDISWSVCIIITIILLYIIYILMQWKDHLYGITENSKVS